MRLEFPSPTLPASSRAEVLVGYLDYFRGRLIDKIAALPADEQRASRLPSGWTPAGAGPAPALGRAALAAVGLSR